MHVLSGRDMSVGNHRKLWSAAFGILEMTNIMRFLRTSDQELLLLVLFLIGFCCWSNATDTNGKSASIFTVIYFLLR